MHAIMVICNCNISFFCKRGTFLYVIIIYPKVIYILVYYFSVISVATHLYNIRFVCMLGVC